MKKYRLIITNRKGTIPREVIRAAMHKVMEEAQAKSGKKYRIGKSRFKVEYMDFPS